MDKFILFLNICILSTTLDSCRSTNTTSSGYVSSIGTDLGNNDNNVYLFYVEGKNISKGKCTHGKPFLPVYCTEDKKTKVYASFKGFLQNAIEIDLKEQTGVVSSIEVQLKALDEAILAGGGNIDDLKKQRDSLAKKLVAEKLRLSALQEESSGLAATLIELEDSNIVFEILKDNDLFQKSRPIVQRFEKVFQKAEAELNCSTASHICILLNNAKITFKKSCESGRECDALLQEEINLAEKIAYADSLLKLSEKSQIGVDLAVLSKETASIICKRKWEGAPNFIDQWIANVNLSINRLKELQELNPELKDPKFCKMR